MYISYSFIEKANYYIYKCTESLQTIYIDRHLQTDKIDYVRDTIFVTIK